MGILRTKTIEPATGSTLTLGASGDTITVSSDSIKANTFKDAGGNTLFTSDGAGTLSSVNSGFAGAGPILISTSTASGSSSIEITSGIDSTYDEYMFVCTNINVATSSAEFGFQVNASGASGYNETITSTNFFVEHLESDGLNDGFNYDTGNDQAQGTALQVLVREAGNGADQNMGIILHIFSPSDTTYVKHFYSRASSSVVQDGESGHFVAGYVNTTTAIDEISFSASTGNFDGTIQMYGIK
jgi:hypothetical protein